MGGVRVVVVGTGTDVGKTHVTACLLAYARAHGVRAGGYKPIATGVVGACDDAEAHARALGAPIVPPTFAYARPVSPHLAAREEGRAIDLDVIAARAEVLGQGVDVLLVETAGGLFTPLGEGLDNASLCTRLAPARVLLVAPDRIGVLSDVRAYLFAARSQGVEIDTVCLSAAALVDASTGSNADELAAVGACRVAAVFPRANVHDAGSEASAAKTLAALGLPGPGRSG